MAAVEIVDHYLAGTRLRLRAVLDPASRRATHYKLAQKVAGEDEPGLITNLYLSPEEYAALHGLPGHGLEKLRLSVPPLGIDVFHGPLEGLVLAEVEFESDDAMLSFEMPLSFVAEVTYDRRFAGATLARTTSDDLGPLLRSFGLGLSDPA
jgi:hypothetical protein